MTENYTVGKIGQLTTELGRPVRFEGTVGQDELPGALALALAVQAGKWPHTMDAQVWAEKFANAVVAEPSLTADRGTMIGWFANAIMAGYDTAMLRVLKPNEKGNTCVSEALRKRIHDADLIILGFTSGDRNLEAKALEKAREYMATYAGDQAQSEFENPTVIFP